MTRLQLRTLQDMWENGNRKDVVATLLRIRSRANALTWAVQFSAVLSPADRSVLITLLVGEQ